MKLNRRDFIKGALATGTLAAGSMALAGCSQAPEDKETKVESTATVSADYMSAEMASKPWTFEIPPEPITDIAETFEADVIVVGAGTAGLVTAYSALQQGLAVMVVSASSKPISRGGSNNAIYSKEMERQGFPPQDPYLILKEIAMNNNNVDHRKWYKYFHASEESMNWLIDIMESSGFRTGIERTSEMAPDSLFYTAPSAHGWINDENSSVGMTQSFVVNTLADKIIAEGGQIIFKNIGRQLVRGSDNNSGRVTAVICEREDGSYAQYTGKKAIVLATGDFSSNREMMMKYAPEAATMVDDSIYDGEIDYDKEFIFGGLFPGDGQRMGLWVGAAWQRVYPNAPMGANINAGTTQNPYQNFWGLLVNRDGVRFMNEYCSGTTMGGRAQVMQPGGESYALWDVNYANLPDWYPGQGGYGILEKISPSEVVELWEDSVKSGEYFKADTLEELIQKLGLPTDETKASIDRYNELCEEGVDRDFFKRSENLFPLTTPPFYGHKASGRPGFLTILGGLRTDDNMRVCDANDNPLEGLYNVGAMVGDFYSGFYTFQMEGINYGACCLTFGHLTGKFIAENE